MTAIAASAPGKIILLGEHAVVYARPAIAVPVVQVQAKTAILANPSGHPGQVEIDAPGIGLKAHLADLPKGHPFAIAIHAVREALGLPELPALRMRITSTIPIASGLGSGAAVSVSLARALSAFLGHPLSDEQVSGIAFQVDKAYHGNPSGIDNTVITYAQPVYFLRDQPYVRLNIAHPLTLVIGDSGIQSPTRAVVEDVRLRWQAEPERYESLFDQIGALTNQARVCLETGDLARLGELLNANQDLLVRLDVSSPELDRLVGAALSAGASGAKLCGGGRGGNMIALVDPDRAGQVAAALSHAGAARTIITRVG